jgi:hypothetical protein
MVMAVDGRMRLRFKVPVRSGPVRSGPVREGDPESRRRVPLRFACGPSSRHSRPAG